MEEHQRRIGQRVIELREARDWGQPELSQASGVSIKTISRIENGHVEGRRDTLRSIAEALGVTRAELEGFPPAPLALDARDPEPPATQADIDRIEAKLDRIIRRLGVDDYPDPPADLVNRPRDPKPKPQPDRRSDSGPGKDALPGDAG